MPTLPDVPDLITGDLLELRAPALEHVDEAFAALNESLAELQEYMPWAKSDNDRSDTELSIRRAVAAFVLREDLRYHMFDRRSGRFVGSTGLHRIKWSVPRFEIGYWVRTSATGKGFAKDAVRALTRTAFEQLGAKRVEIRCDDRNAASAAVAQACGYRFDGLLENFTVGTDGTARDERVYSLIDLSSLR